MAQLVKTISGLAIASVKTVNGLAVASVKTVNGLDNTAGGGGSNVTIDTSAESAGGGGSNTQTISITVASQSNRLLLVGTLSGDSVAGERVVLSVVSSVDGAFTNVNGVNGTGWVRAELWRLTAPTVGAHTITVTFTATVNDMYANAISLYGVDQTTPIASSNTGNSGSGTGPTGTVTLGADDMAVSICASDAEATLACTVGTAQQSIASLNGDTDAILATRTNTGSTAITYTSGNDSFAYIIAAVNGAP